MRQFLKFVRSEQRQLRNDRLLFWHLRVSPRKLASFYRIFSNWNNNQGLGNFSSSVDEAIFNCSLLPFEDHLNTPRKKVLRKKSRNRHPLWFYTKTIEDYQNS